MAERGAAVTMVGRNEDGLAKVLREVRACTPDGETRGHRTLQVDFAQPDALAAAADGEARLGPVHVLVHNTGGPPAGFAIDAAPADFEMAFRQHLVTAQLLAQSFAPGMRQERYGRIVAITSTSVVTPIRGLGVSNVIRAAMANWSRTLAVELAPFGITVNTVLPGFTRTGRLESLFKGRAARAGTTVDEVEQEAMRSIPAGRIGAPQEIAAVVAFLASPAASYLTGANIPVDGGRLALQ